MSTSKAAFQFSLENLRGLAILFVILSHITTFGGLGEFGKYLSFLFGDATSWFVFISSYLFTYIEASRFDYFAYLKKKARVVLCPYLVLSVPAILLGFYVSRDLVVDLEPISYVVWSILVGGSVIVPMWFVPMIVLYFLASPIFVLLSRSKYLPAFVVISMAVSLFTSRPVDNLNPVLQFIHFFGFYMLGIVAAVRSQGLQFISNDRFLFSVTVFGSLILFLLSTALYFVSTKERPIGFYDGLGHFNNYEFGKLAFLFFAYFMFKKFLNEKNKALSWLAEISFGLFFIHGFFMAGFSKLIQLVNLGSGLNVLLTELGLVIFGSMLAVVVAKKILGKWSRYVIGC